VNYHDDADSMGPTMGSGDCSHLLNNCSCLSDGKRWKL